jgi:hypothetical protein
MVAGAIFYLRDGVCFLKLMAKATEVFRSNDFVGLGFIASKDCSMSSHLDPDSEWLERSLSQGRVDKR